MNVSISGTTFSVKQVREKTKELRTKYKTVLARMNNAAEDGKEVEPWVHLDTMREILSQEQNLSTVSEGSSQNSREPEDREPRRGKLYLMCAYFWMHLHVNCLFYNFAL